MPQAVRLAAAFAGGFRSCSDGQSLSFRKTTTRKPRTNCNLSGIGYKYPVIAHFASSAAAGIFQGQSVKRIAVALQEQVLHKLQLLDAAIVIAVLQAIPSLQCKKLGGQRKGQPDLWSIRVNKQWRITFTATEPPLEIRNVDLVDYH